MDKPNQKSLRVEKLEFDALLKRMIDAEPAPTASCQR
jgi:hypothetical protein